MKFLPSTYKFFSFFVILQLLLSHVLLFEGFFFPFPLV
jgi:hypothetical protein